MSDYFKGTWLEVSLWLGFCAIAYAFTFEFNDPIFDYRYGAAGWPRVIIVIIAVCALMLQVTSRAVYRQNGGPAKLEPTFLDKDEGPPVRGKTAILKQVGTFLVPLFYIFLLPRTGFYLTTPFLISGYMFLLGERRWIHLVGTTLLIFVLNILIFTVLLYVPLPVGNWSGFYEINNAFLSLIK